MEFSTVLQHLTDKLYGWLDTLVSMLPNIAVATLVIIVFGFASRWISKGIGRALEHLVSNRQIALLLSKGIRIGVVVVGLFVALGILNLDKTVTSLLAGVGIIGLALGFAFQDIAANFVSGVLLAIRRPFEVEDLVEISDFFGRVQAIDLRATQLTQLTGETIIIPNKKVFQNAIVNYTETSRRRVDLAVGVSYGDDLRLAQRVAIEAIEALEQREEASDVELFYSGFGGSSIDCTIRFWITDAGQLAYLKARSDAIIAVKDAFDENDISIPFPIRTLDVGKGPLLNSLRSVTGMSDDEKSAAQ